MAQVVPVTTPVRRNRAHNIDTPRLVARRAYLIDRIKNHSREFENRIDFVVRAAELSAIENVLNDRGVLDVADRATLPPSRQATT
jgi:hypothetical protein